MDTFENYETRAEQEEREAVLADMMEYSITVEDFEETRAEEIRANTRCCSDPLCPCPKF